jgi:Family of unknown function (DUF5317)
MKITFPYWYYLFLPTALYYFGWGLNILATTVNRGTMPVHFSQQYWDMWALAGASIKGGDLVDDVHSVMKHSDHLKFLADWIQIRGIGTASIGDFFIYLGSTLQLPGLAAYIACIFEDNK